MWLGQEAGPQETVLPGWGGLGQRPQGRADGATAARQAGVFGALCRVTAVTVTLPRCPLWELVRLGACTQSRSHDALLCV